MSPIDELAPILKKLRLSGVLQSLELRVRQTVEDDVHPAEFLLRVLNDERRAILVGSTLDFGTDNLGSVILRQDPCVSGASLPSELFVEVGEGLSVDPLDATLGVPLRALGS